MRLIDFLFYYLTLWFNKNKQQLAWSSPQERAAYAIAVLVLFWALTVWQIIEKLFLKNEYYKIQKIPLLVAGVCALFVFQYIYITKNRYDLIVSSRYRQFKTNETKGVRIVIMFGLISAILPFALAALFNLKHLH